MEIASIKGDEILLLYHPAETAAVVGQQFSILELPEKKNGLLAQIISNDSLEYVGLQQEMIQRILEQRIAKTETPLNHEHGMDEIKSIKVAIAKIRKRISDEAWHPWDGWIPTRNVEVARVEADELLKNIQPHQEYSIESFAKFNNTPLKFDGARLNMVSVVAGVKGSGKSHLAKHLVLGISHSKTPCIVFDINGEYIGLPDAQVLRWGDNFVPDLAEVGYDMLGSIIRATRPLTENSEGVFDAGVRRIFTQRREFCEKNNQAFTIDITFLRTQTWGGGDFVAGAIDSRLQSIEDLGLFRGPKTPTTAMSNFAKVYENACDGKPVVFDMRSLSPALQTALVRAINRGIETICNTETQAGTGRYPFVFFEEAHFYIKEDAILNIITRGRHIGMGSIFITNTPHNLPDVIFRQLDNLFLLALSHKDDIKSVSKNSFTDEETIASFATRMPEHHALIIGAITDRYPLIVSVDPTPAGVPISGQTKSTWDRLKKKEEVVIREGPKDGQAPAMPEA